jgi:hypothetical protein
MQDPTDPVKPSPVKAIPELLNRHASQGTSRSAVAWHATKAAGRNGALVFGALATGYYLKTVCDELWLARQQKKQVLTAEADEHLKKQFPKSTTEQRQKIVLADTYGQRARAEVASEIRYQEVLSQPLYPVETKSKSES